MQMESNELYSRTARRPLWPALALAMSLALPVAAQAAEAMRVVRDPVTGDLRAPTAEELATMKKAEAQLRAKSGKTATVSRTPKEIVHPNGAVEMTLDEDSQMYSVVRANEDGSLAMQCLPAKQAQAWVSAGGKKPAATKANSSKAAAKGHEGHNHD